MKQYSEVITAARSVIGEKCRACPICDGRGCRDRIPGPGSKGVGDTAIRNYDKWRNIRVNMDTLNAHANTDPSLSIFGRTFALPFFAGPVGAVAAHYSDAYDDLRYNEVLLRGCANKGIAAFTGDGINPKVVESAAEALKGVNGMGVPTIKPWNLETIQGKMDLIKDSGCFAVAMDIDAAGLPFLRGITPPAGSKSVAEMKEIIAMTDLPFIIKGVMTAKGAEKSLEAGASAIIVSNHGGRVLDQCPATAEVLPEIVEAVKGTGMKILVDGGIRSGVDIFKALALGADCVLIARPFVTAVYGGGVEGVELLIDKYAAELIDTMEMCGAAALRDITRDMVSIF